jgi:hypothetical protein
MADCDKPVYITRTEFYGALALVWLYIMLVIGDLIRLEWRWTMGLLMLASCVMMISF